MRHRNRLLGTHIPVENIHQRLDNVTDYSATTGRASNENRVTERIEFVEGDWTNGLAGDFHLIVSNPPYVRDADTDRLQPEVRDYEPWLALPAGPDGLDAFRSIVEGVGVLLAPDGRLLLELGAGQAEDLRALVEARGTLRVTNIRDDLQGIPRAAVLRRA